MSVVMEMLMVTVIVIVIIMMMVMVILNFGHRVRPMLLKNFRD